MNYISIFASQNIVNLETKKSLEVDETIIDLNKHQYELKIQELISFYMQDRLNTTIQLNEDLMFNSLFLEENEKIVPFLQEHNILIMEDLKQGIRECNKNEIQKILKLYPLLNEELIVNVFASDFKNKYDAFSKNVNFNVDLYKLCFNIDYKDVSIATNPNDSNSPLYTTHYQVFNLENYNLNKIRFFKEKRLTHRNKTEKIDFAQYINGIPTIGVEVKTPKQGLSKALRDQKEKDTYKYFFAIIGTNGTDVFINSNTNLNIFFKWLNYGDNNQITGVGIVDIFEELFFHKENSLFYIDKCIFINEIGEKKELTNLRVQQYFTSKKVSRDFKKLLSDRNKETNMDKWETYNKYIKHHTRTGKSLTFKAITNIVFKEFNTLFNKVIFFTHDVSSVMESVKRDFGGTLFKGSILKTIKSKKHYKDVVLNKEVTGVFIVNMQKIDTSCDITIDGLEGYKTLILIDEVHTHQEGGLARVREKQFPNASYISATATPKMDKKDKKWIAKNLKELNGREPTQKEIDDVYDSHMNDRTAQLMGDRLDELTPSDAQSLNIIVPLKAQKYKYSSSLTKDYEEKLLQIDTEVEKYLNDKFFNDLSESFMIEIKEKIVRIKIEENKEHELDSKELELFVNPDLDIETIKKNTFNSGQDKIINETKVLLYTELKDLYLNFCLKNKNSIKREMIKSFKTDIVPIKLQILEKEILAIRKEVSEKYNPKFFWVLSSVTDAIESLNKIKEEIQKELDNGSEAYIEKDGVRTLFFDKNQNIYKGIRFAIDVSDYTSSKEERRNLSEEESKTELENRYGKDFTPETINGKLISNRSNSNDIINDFESDEPGCVDVLLLVKKRMMGYDNKQLTMVFLDKTISDIKEMMQISTRTTTVLDGKKVGYMLDLTFDDRNSQTLKMTYAVYDNKDIKNILISEEFIEKTYKEISIKLNFIKSLFDFKENNTFKTLYNNENIYFDKLVTLYNRNILKKDVISQEFFKQLKDLNNLMNDLINPKYQLEKDNQIDIKKEYNALLNINARLYDYICSKELALGINNNNEWFSKEEIKKLIEDIFKSFGEEVDEKIIGLKDLIKLRLTGKKSDININNVNYRIDLKQIASKNTLNSIRISKNSSLKEGLETFLSFLDNDEVTEKQMEEQLEINKKLLLDITKDIENHYENDLIYYIINNEFLDFFKEDIETFKDKEFDKVLKTFAKYYASQISSKLELYIDTRNNRKDYIKNIIKGLNVTVTTFEFLKDNSEVISILKTLVYDNGQKWHQSSYKKIEIMCEEMDEKMINMIELIIDREDLYGRK